MADNGRKFKMALMAALIEEFHEYDKLVKHQKEWCDGPEKLQKLHAKQVNESLNKCLDLFEGISSHVHSKSIM